MRQVVVLATASLAVLTACTTAEPERPALPVTESRGPAGPIPDGIAKFYRQGLTWRSCEAFATGPSTSQAFALPGLQCARVKVPLDYADPQGETITLGLLRKPAPSGADRIGSLLLNPGGPGASGMEAAAQLTPSSAFGELNRRFDIVGFDPRGIGASEPVVRCLTDAERDADRADDGEADGSPAGVRAQEAEERAFARKCAQRTEHGERMLANLGTRDVVRDMDVLRSVLGDERLTYLGYSYGTRIGTAYAEAFPGNVRALLLDGAVDPGQDAVESLIAQGKGFGKAFDGFAAWCARRQDCALGSDPARATGAYLDLARPLIERNIGLTDGRRLSFEDITIAAVQALYSRDLWERLNSALNELERGRGDQLMELADLYHDRAVDGTYSPLLDAHVAVRCVDDPPVTDRARIRDALRRFAKAAPFRDPGGPVGDARDACAFWPVEHTSRPHPPDVRGTPPALVISTTGDPATPYQAGVRLAEAMGGRLLTFEGTQHTVFAQGNACVDAGGVAYLIELELPKEGKRCE